VQIIEKVIMDRMAPRGYDPIWDVQVLSPVNSRTIMSCQGVNAVMQKALNQNPPIENCEFRVGDKIINTRNQRIDDDNYIVNGDLGEIVRIDKKHFDVRFYYPTRIVQIDRFEHDLLLAYCCTTHRYQGSEAKVVIIPVHRSFGPFVDRPWIYTAISRAQEICITVGQFSAIRQAINRTPTHERQTKLRERLAR